MMEKLKTSFLSYLTLFSSLSTLVCCALPALLVSLGLGAALVGLTTWFPSLIWVSEHKASVFVFSGIMLSLNGLLLWRNRNASCPIDPVLRDACIKGRNFSFKIYVFSIGVFLVGSLFAFILPALGR